MNIAFWIFTSLLVVDFILYLPGFIKKIAPLEKTSRSLFVPLTAGVIISILALYLPDSHHIIELASFALAATAVFMLFTLGDKNKFLRSAEEFFYVVSQLLWLMLIVSVYRIYRVSEILFVITGAFYLAGFIVICFFIKKQSPAKYAASLIQYFTSALLGTTAIVCMIYEKRLFSVIMFIGTLALMFGTVLMIFQKTRPFAINEKIEKLLITITAVAASALMGTGAILMQV